VGDLTKIVRFYQKFIITHPFYDGNGRIARLLCNIYLAGVDKTILWSEFDGKKKFLKKLNYCHKNETEESFTVLESYLSRHIKHFDDLDARDDI
jgi:fido (protein-threonine AMPylation protein)